MTGKTLWFTFTPSVYSDSQPDVAAEIKRRLVDYDAIRIQLAEAEAGRDAALNELKFMEWGYTIAKMIKASRRRA